VVLLDMIYAVNSVLHYVSRSCKLYGNTAYLSVRWKI